MPVAVGARIAIGFALDEFERRTHLAPVEQWLMVSVNKLPLDLRSA